MKVLIVEDEVSLREGLEDLLVGAGYDVQATGEFSQGLEYALEPDVDIVILDRMLIGGEGLDLCRRLREKRSSVHVIMLTARGGEDERVEGLQGGADDYVVKPFSAKELLARVESVARRRRPAPHEGLLTIDGLEVDFGRCAARRGGEEFKLTAREANILNCLFQHRGRAVSRGELLRKIWQSSDDLETRTVDMTISNLRRKIERNPQDPKIVRTVKGVGYMWGSTA